MGKLVEYCMIKFSAIITVNETGQSWSGQDDFVMDKPEIGIEVK